MSKYKTLKDTTSGYLHIILDLASLLLTMFNTPSDKFRWLRLLFGLKIASDVFQERLDRVLRLLEGVHGIPDDILTHGETEVQHDGRLLTLLETARMNNLSLNPDKIQFKSTDCKFFRHWLTPEGLKLDHEKVKAIVDKKPLESLQTLQSFNGMVNYLKRFSPFLTELSEQFRRYRNMIQSGPGNLSNKQPLKRLRLHWLHYQSWHTLTRTRITSYKLMHQRLNSVQSY